MKMNTHTRESSKLAQRPVEPSRSQDTLTSRTATLWPQPLPEDQSQLPLMPPTGQDTSQEFSATVPPDLTTVSFWSELQINTGKSRTLGEPHGEKVDSSDSAEETPAVSVTSPHTQTNDLNKVPLIIEIHQTAFLTIIYINFILALD